MIIDFHTHTFPERIAEAALNKMKAASHTVTFTDGTAQTYTVGTKRGDLNGDGKISVADVMLLLRSILNETADLDSDMNGDGKITLVDVVRLLRAITE